MGEREDFTKKFHFLKIRPFYGLIRKVISLYTADYTAEIIVKSTEFS